MQTQALKHLSPLRFPEVGKVEKSPGEERARTSHLNFMWKTGEMRPFKRLLSGDGTEWIQVFNHCKNILPSVVEPCTQR